MTLDWYADKHVVVAGGGGSGMGAAAARLVSKAGAEVTVLDLREPDSANGIAFKRVDLGDPDAIDEAACNSPAAKNTMPMTSGVAPNFLRNQNTMNVWTTKPPEKESKPNSPASFATARREWDSGRERRAPSDSTTSERRRANAAHTSERTGKANSHRWSAGSDGYRWRKAAGPPAARDPTAPAR